MNFFKYSLAIICTLLAFQANAENGISRATFTTAIDNREPTDEVSTLSTDTSKVFYFSEIKGLKGQTLTHRWEHNGEVQANVSFNVGGNRWRVWSSKNLQPEMSGQWQVMIVDDAGNVLSQNSFDYGDTATETATAEPTADTAQPATDTAETQTPSSPEKAATMSAEELSKIAPAAGETPSAPAE